MTAMRQRLRPVPWLLVAPLLAACAGARPTPARAPMSPAEFFTRAVATIQRQHVEPVSATQLADRALRELESVPPAGAIRVLVRDNEAVLTHGESGSAEM